MAAPGSRDVTTLLQSWTSGDRSALDQLMPVVYRELRRVAAGQLRRERVNHTLQSTALVHETYLRLVGQSRIDCCSRMQFFGIAANLMRQILVNHAERHRALKRGGGRQLTLLEPTGVFDQQQLDLLALDQALTNLARLDARQARIVELRFFGGLTEAEIADVMGISTTTVQREWRTARAVLYRELSPRLPQIGHDA